VTDRARLLGLGDPGSSQDRAQGFISRLDIRAKEYVVRAVTVAERHAGKNLDLTVSSHGNFQGFSEFERLNSHR
jgi:hypothetical protein